MKKNSQKSQNLVKKSQDTVPYHRKPDDLNLEAWQTALRKQFAEKHFFNIEKHPGHKVFADYDVYNPETKNTYKVALRSIDNRQNYCACLDFKTNGLGTCKHIEAVKYKLSLEPRLKKYLKDQYFPAYTSVYVEYTRIRKIKIRIGTENSDEFKILATKYFDKNFELLPSTIPRFNEFVQQAAHINPTFRCYRDAFEHIIDEREKENRAKIIDDKFPSPDNLNNVLKTTLFPYQKQGILFAFKAGRCLIADEMGLGKTIQALAATELFKHEMGISKVLIVCPTSLKYQWKTEVEKFTASSVKVLEGNALVRENTYLNDESFYKIVSYHTVINDIETINRFSPDLVILDEAQRIKNFKTKIALNVKKIKSDYALVLTGTPLENKLEELYSIIQFVEPFCLGPFYQFLDQHQIKNETGKVIGYKDLNQIGKALKDNMIRRKKSEVLSQLPERMDKVLFVPMTDKQAELHDEYKMVVNKLVMKWRRFGFLNEKDRQRLLIHLNLMRMVCDSTYIIDQKSRHDTKIDELFCILDEVFESGLGKVIIFSQWERMTRLVSKELDQRQVKYEYLHGGVPSKERKVLFENFNQDPECRVFLSTDAGSTGLNLQAGSMMFNLDIPWNPAVLEQRIARIHRLGQKHNVTVINLVSTGTIEHQMLNVLKFKSSMAAGVLDSGEDTIFMGEEKFKQFMHTIESITSPSENKATPTEEPSEELASTSEPEVNSKQEDIKKAQENVQEANIIDDDIKEQANTSSGAPLSSDPSTLIHEGLSFLSKLVVVLSDKEATEKLVHSMVQKDEQTGKNYLKIPVESEEVVKNAINLFAGIMKMMQK